ncbi:MAG: hypothetical protein KatS3mg129_0756 [Leptospiraceae bacterium]|nr:MAG: hypothetical protein KatS3mg129_0756 [Leptospiraceae bacterium]
MKATKKIIIIYFIILLFLNCFAGGYIEKGGHIDSIFLTPSATNIYINQYFIVCLDKEKYKKEQSENLDITKFITYIPVDKYKGGCEQYGEVSQFYLFHLFPTSGSLDPEYAITLAVQKLEGDTMVNIRAWHETHYYSILGQVRVFKVKGDVIKFQLPENYEKHTKN